MCKNREDATEIKWTKLQSKNVIEKRNLNQKKAIEFVLNSSQCDAGERRRRHENLRNLRKEKLMICSLIQCVYIEFCGEYRVTRLWPFGNIVQHGLLRISVRLSEQSRAPWNSPLKCRVTRHPSVQLRFRRAISFCVDFWRGMSCNTTLGALTFSFPRWPGLNLLFFFTLVLNSLQLGPILQTWNN